MLTAQQAKFVTLVTKRSSDRTQIDEYMFRLKQSQEQHYQEWLNKEPSEAINKAAIA